MMNTLSPGPVYGLPNLTGEKEHDPSSKYHKAPAYTLSPRREHHESDLGPGPAFHPGDHVYRTGREDGRKVVIRGRDPGIRGSTNPAPGQYDPQLAENVTKPTRVAHSFGKKGNEPKMDNLPGPGHYDALGNSNAKTFTIGGRPRSRSKSTSPGPAHYQLSNNVYRQGPDKKGGFTMHGRSESSHGYYTPGPGSYDYTTGIDKTKKRIPGADFGGKAKPFHRDDVPGPGTYSPSWEKDNKRYILGGKDSHLKVSDTPGPGEYSYDNNVFYTGKDGGRPVRITGRPNDQSISKTPGPGWYSPEDGFDKSKKRPLAYSMGEKRDTQMRSGYPGPGSYDPNDLNSPRATQIKGRPKDFATSNTPGPGEYNVPDKVTNRGQGGGNGFTFRGREKAWGRDDIPGPGSYSPEASPRDKTKGPQWSFGNKAKSGSHDFVPGPGSYNPDDGHKVKTVKISDGPDSRKFYETTDTPGPNYYNIDPNISQKTGKSQPAFSLKGREDKTLKSNNPGPGHYDNDKSGGHGPVYTFGSKPTHHMENANPGKICS